MTEPTKIPPATSPPATSAPREGSGSATGSATSNPDADAADSARTSPAPASAGRTLRRAARQFLPWALLAGGVLWYAQAIRPGGLDEGIPAPSLRVEVHGGETFELSAQRGKTVVLNFWAAWCPPCRAEAPALSRVARDLESHGDVMLGLAVDARSITRAASLGMNYSQALASEADVARFAVGMLPTTLVIAPDGSVAESIVGEISETALREAVETARTRAPAVDSR